jgi:transcriptional regulator with XRE-family HTH domain
VNFELFKAIREKGLRQKDFAQLVGENPAKVSMIVNKKWVPDEMTKIKWARALKKEAEELFKED